MRQPTAHPVMENWRVRTFRQLLQLPAQRDTGADDHSEQMAMLGEIMYQVKTSPSLAFLTCSEQFSLPTLHRIVSLTAQCCCDETQADSWHAQQDCATRLAP